MPIIPQTLNINMQSFKYLNINLHTIRKLIKYSLKNAVIKAMFTHTAFEILKLGRFYHPPSRVQRKIIIKILKIYAISLVLHLKISYLNRNKTSS